MSKKTPQAIRGTQDIFGADAEAFAFVVETFERVRRLYRFRRVEMPVFEKTEVFARSLGEFGATITFVSNIPGETRTLPIAIYSALQVPGSDNVVTRLALISVALSLGALLASEVLVRRSGQGRGRHVL